MTKQKHFTRKQIIEALRANGGFITHAAKALGCCYQTVTVYIKADPTIAEELDAIREGALDLAESVLIKAMKGKDSKEAIDASKFTLKFLGRGRGYIRSERFEVVDDLSTMMKNAEERTK